MDTITYTFPSLTQCMKCESILLKYNIPSRIVKIDKNIIKSGCKFGVTINKNNEKAAKAVFNNNRISFKHRLIDYSGELI